MLRRNGRKKTLAICNHCDSGSLARTPRCPSLGFVKKNQKKKKRVKNKIKTLKRRVYNVRRAVHTPAMDVAYECVRRNARCMCSDVQRRPPARVPVRFDFVFRPCFAARPAPHPPTGEVSGGERKQMTKKKKKIRASTAWREHPGPAKHGRTRQVRGRARGGWRGVGARYRLIAREIRLNRRLYTRGGRERGKVNLKWPDEPARRRRARRGWGRGVRRSTTCTRTARGGVADEKTH